MFDKAIFKSLKKRVDPYLEPGEELLSAVMTEAAGMMEGYWASGEVGLLLKGAVRDRNRAEGQLASANMTLAITSRRLLIFKFGKGRSANPKDLLANLPIGEVDSIAVDKSPSNVKYLTVYAHGEPMQLEVRKAVNTDHVIDAFARAKSGAPC